MKRVGRVTTGRGGGHLSDRTTRSASASTISAFPSITSRKARRSGTIVRGSNEAFSARQPTIKHSSRGNPPKYTTRTPLLLTRRRQLPVTVFAAERRLFY